MKKYLAHLLSVLMIFSCKGKMSQKDEDSKKQTISLQPGKVFLWKSGLCLKAKEESTLYIPGAIFPPNVPIGKTLVISDNVDIHWVSKPTRGKDLPDFSVTLKKDVTIKINRNTEVILLKDADSNDRAKTFVVEEGTIN